MHATLSELLENVQPGMLWVSRDGVVRFANRRGSATTRLTAGSRIDSALLAQAVQGVVAQQQARTVTLTGTPAAPGDLVPELRCKVLPGLSKDDAIVLIAANSEDHDDIGFDNLMTVIRSDLRDPLQDLTAALAHARHDRDAAAIDVLCDRVDELGAVLNRLVDLADVWTHKSLLDSERIELWPMLQKAWGQVEPLARSRNLKARFTAQGPNTQLAALYGSEEWLCRVFVECLEAAIRSARPGGSLHIEHRQMGPRALIVLRDSGAFATATPGSTPLDGRSAGPQAARHATRDLIGLKLCRQIVALHGGQLREEHDDGVRDFLIDLPTGAPHRSAGGELDVAQAQQYAKDLAALMARRRGTATPRLAAVNTPESAS